MENKGRENPVSHTRLTRKEASVKWTLERSLLAVGRGRGRV